MSVTVTEQAAAALKNLLDQQNPVPGQVLRLTYDTDSTVKLVLSAAAYDDQQVEYQGETVLVIEPAVSQDLAGSTLDSTGTGARVSLALRQP
jgi:Fe-S cluster assembly iron-binding protein IscA